VQASITTAKWGAIKKGHRAPLMGLNKCFLGHMLPPTAPRTRPCALNRNICDAYFRTKSRLPVT